MCLTVPGGERAKGGFHRLRQPRRIPQALAERADGSRLAEVGFDRLQAMADAVEIAAL